MGWLSIVGAVLPMLAHGATDAAQSAMLSMDEADQLLLQARELQHQEILDARSERFNEAIQDRSERMRERGLLEELDMTDRKMDDKITKDWIGLIRGT